MQIDEVNLTRQLANSTQSPFTHQSLGEAVFTLSESNFANCNHQVKEMWMVPLPRTGCETG